MRDPNSHSTWIIAGATSAIAMQFAQLSGKRGDQIILLARDENKLKSIQADLRVRYQADVDYVLFDAIKMHEHETVVKKCMAFAKYPISLLVAFGVMAEKLADSHTPSQAIDITTANYTGVVSLCYHFLPYFKQQQSGHILVLGSVAGDRGRRSNFDYGAAKAALVPFCEGLRASLLRDHVSVTLMKLGFIDTPMTYGKPGAQLAASPEACAKACLKAADKKVAETYFPWFWRWIMLIVKMMPRAILYRLSM